MQGPQNRVIFNEAFEVHICMYFPKITKIMQAIEKPNLHICLFTKENWCEGFVCFAFAVTVRLFTKNHSSNANILKKKKPTFWMFTEK
jgi:hypothetical protein